jgi:hypothetical protein
MKRLCAAPIPPGRNYFKLQISRLQAVAGPCLEITLSLK